MSTIGDSPVTVIVSAIAAGFSVKSMMAIWSITRTMSLRDSVLKPDNSVVTS